ncbi:MAG: DUF1569 domain-containing protein [Bacteroidia bacterium]|nr:DUF1569 domain-containing protein [Bacteroidia bacterium]
MRIPTSQSEAMKMESREFMQDALPKLMRQLSADSPKQWGDAPSCQHIVEHLSAIVYISRKELNLPLMIPEDKVEKAQTFIWKEGKMFRKGTKAPVVGDLPKKLRFETFEMALDVVAQNVVAFYEYYKDDTEKKLMHPAFGPLDLKSWERIHHMHFVHHLAQFGVLEADMSPDPPQR